MDLQLEQIAPNFNATDDKGNDISLYEFKGKWVILYFYPKDNTSGCTKEACSFRDNFSELSALNAEVIGVSPDSVKSHQNFKNKFDLNFRLISDENKEICNLYGILGEKSMYGKKYIGVVRSTFILDPQSNIKWIKKNVKVEGHIEEVRAALNKLQEK